MDIVEEKLRILRVAKTAIGGWITFKLLAEPIENSESSLAIGNEFAKGSDDLRSDDDTKHRHALNNRSLHAFGRVITLPD
jgi:hypothetical protein